MTVPAPLFRDPIYDGAADPTIIWNRDEEIWWLLYTNRAFLTPFGSYDKLSAYQGESDDRDTGIK